MLPLRWDRRSKIVMEPVARIAQRSVWAKARCGSWRPEKIRIMLEGARGDGNRSRLAAFRRSFSDALGNHRERTRKTEKVLPARLAGLGILTTILPRPPTRVGRQVIYDAEGKTFGLKGLVEPLRKMVPRRGLEPPRPCERQHLKLVRLPIPPPGQRRFVYGGRTDLSTGEAGFIDNSVSAAGRAASRRLHSRVAMN